MSKFVKETDNKGRTFIIQGEVKSKNTFAITRFICQVQEQETEDETQKVADLILNALNKKQ